MADLISREAAIKAFTSKPPEYYHTSYIVGELNCVPAVDAVPVVRCRDCKYWEMPRTAYRIKFGYCNNMHSHVSSYRMPEENYYCPHGERREENAK